MPTTAWRKSSASVDSDGNCVEVVLGQARAAVRDSKKPTGPTLSFAPGDWRAFARWTAGVPPFRQRTT